MFETFTHRRIDTSEAVINLRHAGSGPPVLLLHGHPQTHVMWHKVAPRLAETYTRRLRRPARLRRQLQAADHAGSRALFEARHGARPWWRSCRRSASSASPSSATIAADAAPIAWRSTIPSAIARSVGARHHPDGRAFPAHRHGLRHGLLALVLPRPAASASRAPDRRRSRRVLPAPRTHAVRRGGARRIPPLLHRSRQRSTPCARTTAPARPSTCVSTRPTRRPAGGSPARCRRSGARKNGLDRWYDVLAVWRDWADDVRGHGIDCGHYLAEEAPEETLAALEPFLAGAFRR